MPKQFDCSMNDNGVCSIPDPAAVILGGRLRAASAQAVEAMLAGRDEDLIVAVEGLEPVEPIHVGELEEWVDGAADEKPTEDGVIASCTCGHIYIIRSGGQP